MVCPVLSCESWSSCPRHRHRDVGSGDDYCGDTELGYGGGGAVCVCTRVCGGGSVDVAWCEESDGMHLELEFMRKCLPSRATSFGFREKEVVLKRVINSSQTALDCNALQYLR